MHFLILAYDGTDSDALQRRLDTREAHLQNVEKLKGEGKHLYGAALLDGDKMIGSVMVVNYPSKEVLESEWLVSEPYVVSNVWQNIEIKPCSVAPIFLNK